MLEDNDPSGYKFVKGLAGKTEMGITPLAFPKRSPELNLLEFSFWPPANKKIWEGGGEVAKNLNGRSDNSVWHD